MNTISAGAEVQALLIHANIIFDVIFAWMIDRRSAANLRAALSRTPSVALMGPRQVGKTMLAHNQGTVLNTALLARNLAVTGVTVARYLDLMVDLLLVRRLKPWTFNIGKRLVRSPKVYIRDSGITHALLNISSYNDLLGHPVVGGSWEGFVIENILSVASPRVRAFHYRTSAGAEVDLVLEFGVNERWAIAIKRSSFPSLSKGFHIACEDIKASRRYVVYSGQDSFAVGDACTAISLYDLMQEIIARL